MAYVKIRRRSVPENRARTPPNVLSDSGSAYDRRDSPFISAWSRPPKRNMEEWLHTYGRSPRMGPVTKIAEDLSFAAGRLLCKDCNGEDQVISERHPFWKFWNQPNPLPQFTREAIWQLHQTYLKLVGEACMVIEKDMFGYPKELWPLPPSWMIGTPTAGNPFYTIRTPSAIIAQIHVNDMFIQMELNPADPYGRGLGQAQGVADEVEIDEYAAAFQKRFFYNDATPNSIVSVEGADADALERFEARWNSQHRGVENSHRTAITTGKVTAIKMADNMKDLDMIQGRTWTRDEVLSHFHVPREIMGITENSNRSTAEAAQYIYAQNVLTPELRKRQIAVNTQLVPYWGDDLQFEYDEIIPHNQEFDKAVAIEGWNAGLLLQNEARAKLDMEPTEQGDVFQAPLLFGYVSPKQNLSQGATGSDMGSTTDPYDRVYEETDPATGIKERKASVSPLDQQAIQQMERMQRSAERQARNVFTQHLSRQRRDILNAFRHSAKGKKDDGDGDMDALRQQLEGIVAPVERAEIVMGYVEKLVDWSQDEQQIRDLLSGIWRQAYEQSQGIMENLYQLKNPYKPQVRDVFGRMGGQKIARDISTTTRSRIVEIIDRGLADGLDISDMTQQIGAAADLAESRAQLIAQQETYNAISAANFDSMKESGVNRHKWITRGDSDVRATHRKLNGQIRNIGDAFANGLRYPRDPEGPASEVLRCRCWTVPLRERDSAFVPD